MVDMFCGSGTVPLEAALLRRRVFASDSSSYAISLTKGKLYAPVVVSDAIADLDDILTHVESLPMPDLRRVPKWVRAFFHPRTLKESIRVSTFLRENGEHFLFACLLGILHHQRPGFLSFPSSHLVPYLRTRKYPKSKYPQLYEYRSVAPRLRAKVKRALRRLPSNDVSRFVHDVRESRVELLELPEEIDCVVTSPPYMNALDYERDNRLRLWFLGDPPTKFADRSLRSFDGFSRAMTCVAGQLQQRLRSGGYCVFIVGDQTTRSSSRFPSKELIKIVERHAPTIQLVHTVTDVIPDVRRARRHFSAVKHENILVFQKD